MNRLGLDRFSGLYLLGGFIIVFSIMAPQTFPTMTTLHVIASTQSIAALVALALLVPFVCGQFDLSVGAVAQLSAVCAVLMQSNGYLGTIPAVIFAVIMGAVIGFVNGFVVVKLRVNSFIATLGMTSVLAAALLYVTGGTEVKPLSSSTFSTLTQHTIFGFQQVLLFLLVVAVILWWVLERTPAGRFLHASGANPEAARLTGIRVDRWSWLSLVVSGSLSAFAGTLYVSLTGPSVDFGNGLLLPAFAAVFLGSTQLKPGRMNVWGTLIAIFVLAVGVQGLQLVTGILWVAPLFDGLALIAAVALAVSRERRITRGDASAGGSELKPDTPIESEAATRLAHVTVDEQGATPSPFGSTEE